MVNMDPSVQNFERQLTSFLVEAKTKTYAAGDQAKKEILADGAEQLVFSKKDLYYRDRYYGSDPFFGQEVVFRQDRAIWGLNYFGKCTDGTNPSPEIYQFLMKALSAVTEDFPYRGPIEFTF